MRQKTLENSYLSALCMELHLILSSGIPLCEGLLMLRDEEGDPAACAMLTTLYEDLSLGHELAPAMRKTERFPKYVTDMVEIGSATGHLEPVFLGLSRHYDQQEQISRTIRSAVAYPAILLVMMLCVVMVLVIKVLPIFEDVFHQLGSELSPVAAALLAGGAFLGAHWVPILIVLAAVGVVVILCAKRNLFCGLLDGTQLRRDIASARFASALALTMSSGMDMDASLNMAADLMDHAGMQEKVKLCRAMMLEGQSVSAAVSAAGIFPPLYSRMLSVGVRTGSADTVMSEIATRYESDLNASIDATIGKIEPTLVIIMSVLVGLILLSVMLPMMGVMSSL